MTNTTKALIKSFKIYIYVSIYRLMCVLIYDNECDRKRRECNQRMDEGTVCDEEK